MKLGFIGLGKMGGNMTKKLLQAGHEVVVWNRTPEKITNLKSQIPSEHVDKLTVAASIENLIASLATPRIIWSMLPAGSATQEMLDQVEKFVEKGDIIIDGSNAFYKDTEMRYQHFKSIGMRFLGVGVSGGIIAAKIGYPTMVGGDKSAYEHIVPILDTLGKPQGGHAYFGEGGAGHFVKMIHNGIEYGIMQSLGEGFEVLEKNAPYKFNLLEVSKLWQKNTLVSGFMLDRAVGVLENDPHLEKISGVIAASGEADWTINQAKEQDVEVPIIEHSLKYRKQSQTDQKIQNSYTAKMVAALRNAFGGHEVKKK